MKLHVIKFCVLVCVLVHSACFAAAAGSDWQEIVKKAKGQTIYFNGWGGSEAINDYVKWAGDVAHERYGVTVKHVKVTDIADVVARILAEKSSSRTTDGSVDLIWINGENFDTMKKNDLLSKAYSQLLPNYSLVDVENKPSTLYDFTIPVDNLEVPWGMAQFVFMYDTAKVKKAPANMQELLEFTEEHPGRFTYPAPPAFHGTTFLKQLLIESVDDASVLTRSVAEVDFDAVTAPMWNYLDAMHPNMWRKGRAFATSGSELIKLLDNGEVFISFTFNPNEASRAIENGELPETVRTYVHEGGTIGNSHFVAIPFNTNVKEGSLVFANFLLSPEAQVRKNDPTVWGDPTVLSMSKVSDEDRKQFEQIPRGVATLSSTELGTVLLEPHASWVGAIEEAWRARYIK